MGTVVEQHPCVGRRQRDVSRDSTGLLLGDGLQFVCLCVHTCTFVCICLCFSD